MIPNLTIGDLTIDCANAERARDFYANLMVWEKTTAFSVDHFITLLDPEGHPFCLCRRGNA